MSNSKPKTRAAVVIRIGVGLLFAWAGVFKTLDPGALAPHVSWLANTGSFGEAIAPAIQVLIPGFEILMGVSLVAGFFPRAWLAAACAFLALASAYTIAALAINGARYAGCGCFGVSVLDSGGPVVGLVRNALIGVAAVLALRWAPRRVRDEGQHEGAVTSARVAAPAPRTA